VVQVHQAVVLLYIGREVFVPQPKVQREVREQPPVILGVPVEDISRRYVFWLPAWIAVCCGLPSRKSAKLEPLASVVLDGFCVAYR